MAAATGRLVVAAGQTRPVPLWFRPTAWSSNAAPVGRGHDAPQTTAAAPRTPLSAVAHRLDHRSTAPLVAARPGPSQGLVPVADGNPPRSPVCAADQRANGVTVGTVASRPNPSVEVSAAPHDRASSAAHVVPPEAPAGTGGAHRRRARLETATAANARGVWPKSLG
jgi:hypothetical protein